MVRVAAVGGPTRTPRFEKGEVVRAPVGGRSLWALELNPRNFLRRPDASLDSSTGPSVEDGRKKGIENHVFFCTHKSTYLLKSANE